MSDLPKTPDHRMTRAQFYAWAAQQPRGRYELEEGKVIAMAPERVRHVRAKMRTARALEDAIAAAGLSCEALIDGAAIEIGDHTAYEPDVLVTCGAPVDGDALAVPNPVIVVEVASPSSTRGDHVVKFAAYMRAPSIRHYLLLAVETGILVHHRRAEDGTIQSAILREGPLTLDPPGLTIQVEQLFPKA
ncbi:MULTISPECIES: Uma2 family endonuclease [Roseomonadaceae]|uniref:Uma2 family endonuclease n=1 Tax=Falsiroseomonas oleicola TaxID=2801474 RepID=A0ABS6HGT3_9PROT|nr:Uma2 family endonuclease [Roseomonas oleicola]MBU8546686.1 Uma2 family endonuclease [Roseomonas oleicola]